MSRRFNKAAPGVAEEVGVWVVEGRGTEGGWVVDASSYQVADERWPVRDQRNFKHHTDDTNTTTYISHYKATPLFISKFL